jgi:hypothetical protein
MSNPTDDPANINTDTETETETNDATSSVTDDSSVGLGNRYEDDDDEPSQQDAHNPETEEDTASGGPAD